MELPNLQEGALAIGTGAIVLLQHQSREREQQSLSLQRLTDLVPNPSVGVAVAFVAIGAVGMAVDDSKWWLVFVALGLLDLGWVAYRSRRG